MIFEKESEDEDVEDVEDEGDFPAIGLDGEVGGFRRDVTWTSSRKEKKIY